MFFRRRRACAKKKEIIDPISRNVIHNKVPYTVCKNLIKKIQYELTYTVKNN